MKTETLAMASTQGNPDNFFQHPAPLGSNLYDRDRVRAIPPEGRQSGVGVQLASAPNLSAAAESKTADKVLPSNHQHWICSNLLCNLGQRHADVLHSRGVSLCAVLCCAVLCCAVLQMAMHCNGLTLQSLAACHKVPARVVGCTHITACKAEHTMTSQVVAVQQQVTGLARTVSCCFTVHNLHANSVLVYMWSDMQMVMPLASASRYICKTIIRLLSTVQEAKPNTGLHELSLLANLIKPNASKASNFKLNLFGDTRVPADPSPSE